MTRLPPDTRARQLVAGEVSAILRLAGAPAELAAWSEGKPVDRLWDECLRADWLIWVAAVEKIPLVALVDGAIACVTRVAEAQPEERGRLERAIEAARALRSNEACRQAAKACEARASREQKAYRDRPADPYGWAARAAADLAEAADALMSAEAKRAADRDLAGVGRGAAIGVGEHLISSSSDGGGPLVFDAENDLTYGCVVALEESVRACVRALIASASGTQAQAEAAETVANDLFAVIDPVREGMRRGVALAKLVRKVPAKLYADEGSERIPERRRPMMATAAALLIPVGGGHYHARQGYTGAVLTLGIALQLIVPLRLAWVLIVLADAWQSRRAMELHDEGVQIRPVRQVARGLVIVAVAYALAYALGGYSGSVR